MTFSDKDSERNHLLNCPSCGFHYKIGEAAKPICPECKKDMDLAKGTREELEELRLDLDKLSCFIRGFGPNVSIKTGGDCPLKMVDEFTIKPSDLEGSDANFPCPAVVITEENVEELYNKIKEKGGSENLKLYPMPTTLYFENFCGSHSGVVGQIFVMPKFGCYYVIDDMAKLQERYDIITDQPTEDKGGE